MYAISLTVFLLVTLLHVHQADSVGNSSCLPVYETQIVCPDSSGNSASISLQCPTDFTLLNITASLYRTQSSLCPSNAPLPSDCIASSAINSGVTGDLAGCKNIQTCSSTIQFPPIPASDSCEGENYYAVVTYLCEGFFSIYPDNTTAWAIAIDQPVTYTISMVNINSLMSGLLGDYVSFLDTMCTVTIPANVQIIIKPIFYDLDGSGTTQCVVISDVDQESYSICSMDDAPLVLPCKGKDRVQTVKYTTGDITVKVIFVVQFQVSYLSEITVTCGLPMDSVTAGYVTPSPTLPNTTTVTTLSSTSGVVVAAQQWQNAFNLSYVEYILAVAACVVGGIVLLVSIVLSIYCLSRKLRAAAAAANNGLQKHQVDRSDSVTSTTSGTSTTSSSGLIIKDDNNINNAIGYIKRENSIA